ncbi:hypothetical protein [Flavobacterium sp. GSP14]
MLKNILKLKGAQELNKNEQKSIKGGACHPQGLVGYINGVRYVVCHIV